MIRMPKPKFKSGQLVKININYDWAKNLPPQVIRHGEWDESLNCYTYSFFGGIIRIREHDITPILNSMESYEPATD